MVVCARKNSLINMVKILSTIGIAKFLLNKEGYHIDKGGVIVAESGNAARSFLKQYQSFDDVRVVKSLSEDCLNYEVAIYHYCKEDKREKVNAFLSRECGFPVVIVDGIIPEFLRDADFIFLLKQDGWNFQSVEDEYKQMKKFIINECPYVQKNLRVIKQTKKYKAPVEVEKSGDIFEIMMAVAEIWKMYNQERFPEIIVESEYKNIASYIRGVVCGMERMSENYTVYEAVRDVIFQYARKNPVNFREALDLSNFEKKEGIRVLYDEKSYYFRESDLRDICQPLLKTVSFLQLKSEMFEDGMISCHNTKIKNFTVNRLCFDTKTGKSVRTRFIRIPKEYLISEEGLLIEDCQCECSRTAISNRRDEESEGEFNEYTNR